MHSLGHRTSLVILGALIACSLLVSLVVVTPQISLDDPFIGLRYAHNLVDGHGLVFNPGEFVEGYTAFLWVMVGALGIALGFEPLSFWQVGLLLSQALTLWLLFVLGRGLGRDPDRAPGRALVAPALLALHVAAVSYPMTGMETSFVTLTVTLAVVLVARDAHGTRRGSIAVGGVLLVMCLARFDALVLAGLLLGYEVLFRRRLRSLVPAIAVLAVGLAAYNAWRVLYYGDWLPNTFHVKTNPLSEQLGHGADYMRELVLKGGPYALLLVLLPLVWRKASRTMRLSAWMAGGHLAYVFAVGGDWMPYFRFILPVLPLLCLLLQDSVWAVYDSAAAGGWPSRLLPQGTNVRQVCDRGLGAGLVLLLVANVLPLARSNYVRYRGGPWAGEYFSPTDAKKIGLHLDQRLGPHQLVAVEWAGIIPFYMRQPMFDIFGLSDREVVNSGFPGGRMGRAISPEYLAARKPKPDIVIYCGRIYPTLEKAQVGPDCRVPHGTFIHGFYKALATGGHGYEDCIMKMEGGYWPFLVRRDLPNKAALCDY